MSVRVNSHNRKTWDPARINLVEIFLRKLSKIVSPVTQFFTSESKTWNVSMGIRKIYKLSC